jgi:hypothetical protein
MTYGNGATLHFTGDEQNEQGTSFEGPDGWIFVNRDVIKARPKSLLSEKIGPNEIHLPVSNHHQRNFLDAVKARSKPVSPIESAVCSDIVCQLANIATRLGRKLRWDPQKEKFIDDNEANAMLKRAMRSPWHL